MTTFLITFGIVALVVLLMAIGVIFGRKPISGSCGGYAALKVECAAGCKNPCMKRRIANAVRSLRAEKAESGQ